MRTTQTWRNLSIGLLALSVAACGGVRKEKKTDDSALTKAPDTVYIERIVERIDTVHVVEKAEAEVLKTENKLVAGEYYVVGGSFRQERRASNFKDELVQKGYQAQILKPYKGFTRVAIRAYENEQRAREELGKLRKTFNNVGFWLLMPS